MTARKLVTITTTIDMSFNELYDAIEAVAMSTNFVVNGNTMTIETMKLKLIKRNNTDVEFYFGDIEISGMSYVFQDKKTHLEIIYHGTEDDYSYGDIRLFLSDKKPSALVAISKPELIVKHWKD